MARKPKLAVFKFSSCGGCQLALLDLEEELLEISDAVRIAYFMEASRAELPAPYDIALVEGAVSTPHEADLIKEIRKKSKFLVAIGACATAGGIQALRNWKDVKEFLEIVYPTPEFIQALDKAAPLSDFVKVDYELRGCPVNRHQVLELLNAYLNNRRPNIPPHSLCIECKIKGNICIMVAEGIPCLGPVTQAGCGAICPSYGRGCYGCFGPMESPNPESLAAYFEKMRIMRDEIGRMFREFTGWSKPFKEVSEKYEE